MQTEMTVRLWAALAVDGHYTNALKLALGCLYYAKTADPIERGAAECRSDACIAFIRTERNEIVRTYADGITTEDLAMILSHI